MANPQDISGADLARFIPGIIGSLISLRFIQGTWTERLLMFVGGVAVSYYAATPIADWAGGGHLEGPVGFTCGLLGMAIVAKAYELIQMIDTKQLAERLASLLPGGSKK